MKGTMAAAACTALLFTAGALCGCPLRRNGEITVNDPRRNSAPEKEVSFLGYKADALNLIIIEETLRAFTNRNGGINVVYEGLKSTDYWSALDKRNRKNVLDDIFMIDHDRVIEFKAEGRLADLSDILDMSVFTKAVREQITDETGAVYFVPMNISSFNLYINYDVLERHGQKIPENYAEFSAVCDYFVSQGITPLIVNNLSSLKVLMNARSMYDVYQAEDTRPAINKFNENPVTLADEYEEGIDMVAEMIDKKWIDASEALATTQTSGDLALFEKNERPFMVTGGWASVRVKAAAPELNYGVHPFPVLESGSVLVMDVNTCVSVHANSENVAEAKKLVSYMMQPGVLWDYCNSQSSYMAINDDRIPDDKALAPSNGYLTNGRSVIGSDYRLTVPIDSYLVECGTMLLNGIGADDVKAHLRSALGRNSKDRGGYTNEFV